jgi:hypothetical protein
MAVRATAKRAVVVMILSAAIANANTAAAGPGEAASGRKSAGANATNLAGADHVVVIWYRLDQPLETFKYQTYDIRKGEYTPAVDDWIALMHAEHSRYLVLVRKVDLSRERGDTDQLKIGSVIHRELLIAAAHSGVILGAPLQIGPGSYATQRQTPNTPKRVEMPGAGGASNLAPGAAGIPMFPRPRGP